MFDLRAAWRWLIGEQRETPSAESAATVAGDDDLERPWLYDWEHLPKRSAGSDFSRADYRAARKRALEVAQTTLGSERGLALVELTERMYGSKLKPTPRFTTP